MEKTYKRRAAFHNLGCKVNAYEMEKMAESLISDGFLIVPFEEEADYYIVNTCSVTNIADRKSRQMLHRAKEMNPGAVVIAAGCYVDTRGKDVVIAEGIDIAVPNSEKIHISDIIKAWEEAHPEKETAERAVNTGVISLDEGYNRKFLKVQDGCNMFCTYCIIPYARGRIRSSKISDVVRETKEHVELGFREFVISGIHLSSFGRDRAEDKEDLIGLITALDKVEGVERIRISSLEPNIITEEAAKALASLKSFCPHFHLSLQSGCDKILKRMNRQYEAGQYKECVDMLRSIFDDPAVTTDVIVGFPGETFDDFLETRDFLKDLKLYRTHLFPFSKRKGTPAYNMDNEVTRNEKHERLLILKEIDRINRESYEERHFGKEAEVLVEDDNAGYTREYIRVKCEGNGINRGKIVKGTISGRDKSGEIRFIPYDRD